jgi:TatA/E family protein of Tat protein translocase
MAGLTPAHLLIILVIALVVIGPGKLPEVGAALGKSIREFQKASGGITNTLTGVVTPPAQQPGQAQQPPQPAPPAQSYFAAPPAYPAPAAPVYPAPAAPPAYPAPAYSAPAAPPQVGYPAMPGIEPAPAAPQVAPPQVGPMGNPQPDSTTPQPPTPPTVG